MNKTKFYGIACECRLDFTSRKLQKESVSRTCRLSFFRIAPTIFARSFLIAGEPGWRASARTMLSLDHGSKCNHGELFPKQNFSNAAMNT